VKDNIRIDSVFPAHLWFAQTNHCVLIAGHLLPFGQDQFEAYGIFDPAGRTCAAEAEFKAITAAAIIL